MSPVIAALPAMGTNVGTESRALAITRSRSLTTMTKSRALTVTISWSLTVTKSRCVRVSR